MHITSMFTARRKINPCNHERLNMKPNVGTVDRVLRIVGGLVLIGLAVSGTIGVWGYLGVALLLTGVFRFCPAYPLLGMNTCPMKDR